MAEEKVAPKELSYEELKNVAVQLEKGYRELEGKLKSLDMTLVRLQYLFKVVEFSPAFDNDFVDSCIEEIKAIMVIPKEEKEEDVEG